MHFVFKNVSKTDLCKIFSNQPLLTKPNYFPPMVPASLYN